MNGCRVALVFRQNVNSFFVEIFKTNPNGEYQFQKKSQGYTEYDELEDFIKNYPMGSSDFIQDVFIEVKNEEVKSKLWNVVQLLTNLSSNAQIS